MNDELKPCPFCGEKARLYKDKDYQIYSVVCSECDAATNNYGIKQDAIDAWNKRTQPTFTPNELDAIRRMFECRYPRPQQLSAFETTIINKCKAALKGEHE